MANKPNLVRAIGNKISTTLNGSINSSVTTITVTSGSGFSSSGGYIIIDKGNSNEEVIYVQSVSGATLTVATDGRGLGSLGASAHSSGATVNDVVFDDHINGLVDAFSVEHNDDGTHNLIDNAIVMSNANISTSNKALDEALLTTYSTSGTKISGTNKIIDVGSTGYFEDTSFVSTGTSINTSDVTLTSYTITTDGSYRFMAMGTFNNGQSTTSGVRYVRMRIKKNSTVVASGWHAIPNVETSTDYTTITIFSPKIACVATDVITVIADASTATVVTTFDNATGENLFTAEIIGGLKVLS